MHLLSHRFVGQESGRSFTGPPAQGRLQGCNQVSAGTAVTLERDGGRVCFQAPSVVSGSTQLLRPPVDVLGGFGGSWFCRCRGPPMNGGLLPQSWQVRGGQQEYQKEGNQFLQPNLGSDTHFFHILFFKSKSLGSGHMHAGNQILGDGVGWIIGNHFRSWLL